MSEAHKRWHAVLAEMKAIGKDSVNQIGLSSPGFIATKIRYRKRLCFPTLLTLKFFLSPPEVDDEK